MFYVRNRISTKNIERFLEKHKTDERVIVIHSEDVPYEKFFPNAFTVTKREQVKADMHVDLYYNDVSKIEAESYDTLICTGLLEHVPDPQRLINEFYRILKPGGKLVLQASSVFSIHEGPDDFFHFTHYGFEKLLENWKDVQTSGSCMPYETLAILMQRIMFQTNSNIFVKVATVVLFNILPLFDKGIKKQFTNHGRTNEIDSMLPSNMQAVAYK